MRDVYVVSTVKVTVMDDAPTHLHEMLSWLSQNCADATLASLAAHFGMHPNTAASLLRRETGSSFTQLVRQMRMARAAALLECEELPVLQVARLCGYEEPRSFYRAFREEFGTTPRLWLSARSNEAEPTALRATA